MASNGSLKLKSASLLDMYKILFIHMRRRYRMRYMRSIRPHMNLQSQII